IKQDERQKLAPLGDMTSRAAEHVLGLDGVAVVVHPANSVERLSMDQLRAIFSGSITNWQQVGGAPGVITRYARDDKSGTFDVFKSVVLHDSPLAGDARRFESSEDLVREVSADSQGVGFVGLPFIGRLKALKISEGNGIPMKPTVLTVRT